jgi:tetratricopeptide (TPR) repeat protein
MLFVSLPGAPSEVPPDVTGLHHLALLKDTTVAQLQALAASLPSVEHVLAGKHSNALLMDEVARSWPQAKVHVFYQDMRQWRERSSAETNNSGSVRDAGTFTKVAIAAKKPAPSNTPSQSVSLEKQARELVRECYLHHAWGEQSHQTKIHQLQGGFELLLNQNSELMFLQQDWDKAIREGREAHRLANELTSLFRSGKSDAEVQAWLDNIGKKVTQRIARHLRESFKKACKYRQNNQQKIRQAHAFKPSMPALELTKQGHPNAIANLQPSAQWTLVIDETGQSFSAEADELDDTSKDLGKVVGLLLPQGMTLPALPDNYHATDKSTDKIEQVLVELLKHPVGIFGFTSKDPVSGRYSWFQKIQQLSRWVLQLLPMQPGQVTRVDIQIEQRSGYNASDDLKAVGELLMADLMEINPDRFGLLRLNMNIIDKNGHPANGYVDTIANCWGSQVAAKKKLLNLAKLPGHCLIRPSDDAVYERLLSALEGRSALRPADWYDLLQSAGGHVENNTAMVFGCLQQLGSHVKANPRIWNSYLREVQLRLRTKDYQLSGLARALDWLEKYQPDDLTLPGGLKLQQQSVRLALANHQGYSDNAALLELVQLATTLKEEMAPQACEALLRVVVAATNAMDFSSCEGLLDEWLALPVATVGLLNHGKLHSTKGQLLAFQGRYQEADTCFTEAMRQFGRLSDSAQAKREINQTRSYQQFAYLRNPALSDEPFKDGLMMYLADIVQGNSTKPVFERLARSGHPVRFAQQLGWRAMQERPAVFVDEQAQMLKIQDQWLQEEDHPWPLIMFWRGWALWQSGQPQAAQALWQEAIVLCADNGPALLWISQVWQAVTATLSGDIPMPSEAVRAALRDQLPLANHTVLEQLCTAPQTESSWLLAQLEACLPFNFH